MNKEEIKTQIDAIPKFVLRDVAVQDSCLSEDPAEPPATWWVHQPGDKAVTEENSTKRLAYMTSRYKIVQFKDHFGPILDQFDDVDGSLKYFQGFAIMDLFPAKDDYQTEDKCKIGVTAYNSVDKSSALNIRFCVQDPSGRILTVPRKMASFRKLHIGRIGQLTQDYIGMLGTVKAAWTNIVTKFSAQQVKPEDFDEMVKQFDLDETAAKKMRVKVFGGQVTSVWDFCMQTFDMISQRYYKSDVHKRKRMDDLCTTIFTYNLVAQLAPAVPPDPGTN